MVKKFEVWEVRFVWLDGELYTYSSNNKDLEWVESCSKTHAIDVAARWLDTSKA
jgi:hypothetical protein